MSHHTLDRRTFLAAAAGGLAGALTARAQSAENRAKPNVLFICVDDLRPQLGCYGNPVMSTPHLDRLAESGVVFMNHFVQVPTCGASRCSLWTGRQPRTLGALGNGAFHDLPRTQGREALSLPEFFHRNGYRTASIGKTTHSPSGRRCAKPTGRFDAGGKMTYSGPDDGEPELAHAWDDAGAPTGAWGDPWSAFFAYAGGKTRSYTTDKSPAYEAADVPDAGYPDGLIADAAVEQLRALKDEPFFLAVGFYKPHLPFCAPQRYYDRYDRAAIPLAKHREPPKNVDLSLSLHRNGELTGRYAALADPAEATDEEARALRHGYFASVSYTDAQIGKVLDELERLGLADNTIVVVWGDHGWHLGDLHVWGKHTTYEFALRSALLVRAPGVTPQGVRAEGLTESLDLFPTLAACCRLEAPSGLDGADMSALWRNPGGPGKDRAFGYWRRGKHTATSMRTPRYRYVEWRDLAGNTKQTELYDHHTDPDEAVNVAAQHPEIAAKLRGQMGQRAFWAQ